ncbi:3-dehydroquinate synthase [Micromonospora sp. WMMA1363]|uniref:3-dehydroquinate synthase family protein n=1 Tax=Micromonospora sp. WMMA1363 TaxID=3053985 RepID=UPI00259CE8C8|nr:3-dehydroquinate synthase [Micromonospora sp. WMMA1363]MDM4721892.1 3-dehydroquinate synthase [Micromonospora sp. WMMA1363]
MPRLQKWDAQVVKPVQWSTMLYDGLLDLTSDEEPTLFGDLDASRRRFIAVDQNVWTLYQSEITGLLDRFGVEWNDPPCVLPGGEAAKTRESTHLVYEAMESFGVARFGEPPIAIGGGVLHDVCGLAAGEYRRGVSWDFIATTLVSAIDAMFALKCGVSEGWKNRAGLYHPARSSATDARFFRTLGQHHVRDGFAEITKIAVAGDPLLFRVLEEHGPQVAAERFQKTPDVSQEILERSVTWMMRELTQNPFEHETARASYLGHSISPGLEPTVTHGHAVALDIAWTSMVAWRRELVGPEVRDRILRLIKSLGLDVWHPAMADTDRLLAALADATRHRGGRQLVPTPVRIGQVTYLDISGDELCRAVEDQHRWELDDLRASHSRGE